MYVAVSRHGVQTTGCGACGRFSGIREGPEHQGAEWRRPQRHPAGAGAQLQERFAKLLMSGTVGGHRS